LPTHIIGIPNFFDGLSLKKNEIIKYKIENGKNNITQNENFESSQNLGFFKFIFF
tara:strand:- start:390 stop:554 length:165 start_codon:yes stop_codon:yes gene_type:complete